LLQRRARAVAEPRGEGDGADRWGPGWQRLGAGGHGRLAAEWAGGACWAERPRRATGLARLRGWAAGKEMAMGPKVQEERERGIFLFFFFQTNFPKAF